MMSEAQINEFANRREYLTPSRYISGRIVEYDIRSANITMLKKYHLIDDTYYNYLNILPKKDREIEIGNLIRTDINYYDTISSGIIEAKKLLLSNNDINASDIVRIANDAVYINKDYNLKNTIFDIVEFRRKSEFSVMLQLPSNIIIFFINDGSNFNLDIKGMSEMQQSYHANYMITFIASLINTIQRVGVKEATEMISMFYNDYVNLKLDKRFYVEFNSRSKYKLKNSNYYMDIIDDINSIDISYNQYVLRELYSIILEMYMGGKR
jgi:hypothetical protein